MKVVQSRAPELVAAVRAGQLTVPQALLIAKIEDPEARAEAVADALGRTDARAGRRPGRQAPRPHDREAAPSEGPGERRPRTLAAVVAAAEGFAQALDAMPEPERPVWWLAVRNCIRVVTGNRL